MIALLQTVIIAGDCGERSLTREIAAACIRSGGAIVYDGMRMRQEGNQPSFLVLSLPSLPEQITAGSIIVLGKAAEQTGRLPDLSGYICILDGENPAAVRLAAAAGAIAVGCSMSGHDTLTVSGFNEDDTMLVTLRRRLVTDAVIREPCELTVHRSSEQQIYPALAATGVLLLSGRDSDL